MNVETGIQMFMDHRRGKGVSPATLDLYARWFELWQRWRRGQQLPEQINRVEIAELRRFFVYLATEHVPHQGSTRRPAAHQVGMAPASRDSAWRLLRTLWNFLARERVLSEEQRDYFRDDRVPRPRVPQRIRPVYSEQTVELLVQTCQLDHSEEEETRNQAILLLLLESGMRVAELAGLRDEDLDLGERQARIIGKGDRQRWVFWDDRAHAALSRYLRVRRGHRGGAVFRGIGSKNDGDAMSTDAIRAMVRRLAERAGAQLPAGAPIHALRHTFAREMCASTPAGSGGSTGGSGAGSVAASRRRTWSTSRPRS
jgi:site-specific recombinase XerD